MSTPTKKSSVSLLDLFGVAAGLSVELIKSQPDPLAVQAIEMTTARPLEELAQTPEALAGAVASAKGKYFELLVEEKLNSGHQIDDLVISGKEAASLADSMNQPGWDLKFTDAGGNVVDTIQLKATDSVGYIRDTLERYPDIQIVATSEVAAGSQFGGMVLDSGIKNAEITETVERALGATPDSFPETFLDNFNPLIPLALIAATEGYRLVMGEGTKEACVDGVVERVKNSLTGTAAGALAVAFGLGPFSIIPAIWAAHAGPEKILDMITKAVGEFADNWKNLPGIEGYYMAQRPEVKAAREAEAAARREEEYQRLLARVRRPPKDAT